MFFKKKIVNETFGNLVYKYDWRREITYDLWGKTHNLVLIVESSNEEHEILEIQEQAYKAFLSRISEVEECVKAYFLHNYYDLIEDYYLDFGTSWGCTAAEKKQIQNIIDSYDRQGKDAINDMLLNISISSITVEKSSKIILYLYVNVPDGHGLIVLIDSDIKIFIPEEYDDYYNSLHHE
ncbi:MAG: hypothetical protein PUC65_05795 [Clostridiales bacterium]|nr:hypothetical protein [Clostridiales bacterium]